MNIEKFVRLRKYLYHLTDEKNIESILCDFTLKSTATLVRMIGIPNEDEFLHSRRIGHKNISNGKLSFWIRDQDPLSEKITSKNLENGITFSDFVYLLNSRVFLWAKESDLWGHYARYEKIKQHPWVIRIATEDLFAINRHQPKFCRLNSGAPRCSSYYKEGAPSRGENTFLSADFYDRTPSSVREVTFENYCKLPPKLSVSKSHQGSFKNI